MNCTVSTTTSSVLFASPTHGVMSNEYKIIPMKTALTGSMMLRSIIDDAAQQPRRVGRRNLEQRGQPLQPLGMAWFHKFVESLNRKS